MMWVSHRESLTLINTGNIAYIRLGSVSDGNCLEAVFANGDARQISRVIEYEEGTQAIFEEFDKLAAKLKGGDD